MLDIDEGMSIGPEILCDSKDLRWFESIALQIGKQDRLVSVGIEIRVYFLRDCHQMKRVVPAGQSGRE